MKSHRELSLRRMALNPLLRADQPPTERIIFKLGFRRFNPYILRYNGWRKENNVHMTQNYSNIVDRHTIPNLSVQ